jgi:hypothetical protein
MQVNCGREVQVFDTQCLTSSKLYSDEEAKERRNSTIST